jgi:hypothetical protein
MGTLITFVCKNGNSQMQLCRKTDSIGIEIRDSENDFTYFDVDVEDVMTLIEELKHLSEEIEKDEK